MKGLVDGHKDALHGADTGIRRAGHFPVGHLRRHGCIQDAVSREYDIWYIDLFVYIYLPQSICYTYTIYL